MKLSRIQYMACRQPELRNFHLRIICVTIHTFFKMIYMIDGPLIIIDIHFYFFKVLRIFLDRHKTIFYEMSMDLMSFMNETCFRDKNSY